MDTLRIRAGNLRTRITVQRRTQPTQDAYGVYSSTWATLYAAWASIDTISGSEIDQQGQQRAELTHAVTIRHVYNNLPRAKDRILFGSRVLEIVSAVDTGDSHRAVVLSCREIVAQ